MLMLMLMLLMMMIMIMLSMTTTLALRAGVSMRAFLAMVVVALTAVIRGLAPTVVAGGVRAVGIIMVMASVPLFLLAIIITLCCCRWRCCCTRRFSLVRVLLPWSMTTTLALRAGVSV